MTRIHVQTVNDFPKCDRCGGVLPGEYEIETPVIVVPGQDLRGCMCSYRIVRFIGGPLDGRSLELPDSETEYQMLGVYAEAETAADLPVMGTYHRTGDEMRWTAKETPA